MMELPCFFILWPEAHQCYIFNLKNNLLNFSDSTSCGTSFIHGKSRLRINQFWKCILLWAPAIFTWIMPPSLKAISCSTLAYLLGNAQGKSRCPWMTNTWCLPYERSASYAFSYGFWFRWGGYETQSKTSVSSDKYIYESSIKNELTSTISELDKAFSIF